ncbi:MAG: hypothetical protein CEE40_07890 [Chloroflexi bacterium B3_Chlor]|nr:MAG: hypothetical protein CEE40_07890 [Chloroflexi bacterium B3_Chlor]
MTKLDTSVVINRRSEEVFAYVTDYDTHLQWQSGILEAKVTSEGPLGVGSQYTYVMQMLGRRVETAGEITEHEPPRKHGWKATSGPFPVFQGTFLFEPIEGGTKVSLLAEGQVGGFFKLAEPLAMRMVRRQLETSLNNLKDLLEAQA